MSDFSEKIKQEVREKAFFRCCRCQRIGVQVHHIIPQESGGKDDFDNAAPLCAQCHNDFGANPDKRKEIRQMRDFWYKTAEELYKTPVYLEERPKPRELKKQFPVIYFCHKSDGHLHLSWPNEFLHYYLDAASLLGEMSRVNPDLNKKLTDPEFYTEILGDLIERLIFMFFSQLYFGGWLLEKTAWQFPWMTQTRFHPVDTSEIGADRIDYFGIEKSQINIFSRVRAVPFSSFQVPKGTRIWIDRDAKSPKNSILMENDYYKIRIDISFIGWSSVMAMPEWLSGLDKEHQKQFATITYQIVFTAGPKNDKVHDDKISFYQKWAENLCEELSQQFNWLKMLDTVKQKQIFEMRGILDHLKRTERG